MDLAATLPNRTVSLTLSIKTFHHQNFQGLSFKGYEPYGSIRLKQLQTENKLRR
jgi:hypothetical protein